MKKINFKGLTAAFLSLMLISSMVIIHSSATSEDFETKYKNVLESLSAVVSPNTVVEKVTAETAESYDNANRAYKLLSADKQKALESYDTDITNKLEACARRAKIFTEGSFYFDFENDSALAKYLYTAQNSNKEFVFSTVQHGTAIPEITETFVYEKYGAELEFELIQNDSGETTGIKFKDGTNNDRANFADVMTSIGETNSVKPPRFQMEAGVYKYGDKVCLSGVRNDLHFPRILIVPAGSYNWEQRSYGESFKRDSNGKPTTEIGNVFLVGEIVNGNYQPYTLTVKTSYEKYDTDGKYYASVDFGSEYQTFCKDYNVKGQAGSRFTKEEIATSVKPVINDYTGTAKYKHVKTLTVSYPEVLADKCAAADNYANGLDVTNITASMADDINKYYSLSVACGDNDYITTENKAKLLTAKKVSDYLVKNNIDKIDTPASINALSAVITDKTAVTKLYNETQEIIKLDLSGMFSDAQLAKINSMNNAVGLMGGAESYDATNLVKAAVAIAELRNKQIVNDISFDVELTKAEKAVSALGTYKDAVSNKSVLEGIRASYNALVASGKYTDDSNYTFTKTGKRYANVKYNYNDVNVIFLTVKDTGVVSYINNPSLSAGINEISFTLPVSTYNEAANNFVYSYDGIDSEAGFANISAFGFFGRQDNPNIGDSYTIHKESAKASTTLIPQDTSYYYASMYAYETADYKTRLETNRVPADYDAVLNDSNNLVWYKTKENVGKAVTNQELSTDLNTYIKDNGYSCYYPNGNMNVTMEYQGDANLVKGYNWYLITISGKFCTGKVDGNYTFEDGTVYSRLFTKGRITTAGVTHDAKVEPTDVLKILDIKVNKTPTALTAGASVRIADVKNGGGIRFESKVNTDLYNSLKDTEGVTVSLGTIIVPEEYRNGKDINFDNFKTASNGGTNEKKNLCVDIPQTKWQDEANGIYTAALINLKEANYTKQFAARGYMKVTYADGTEEYFYSDFDADGNVRSIQAVASAALADTSATYTEAQKAILKVFAGQS